MPILLSPRVLRVWLLAVAPLALWFLALGTAQAQPAACTAASVAQCRIDYSENVANVPAHLRAALGLPAAGEPVAVPRVAIVVPDNGTLASPPVVFFAGGHGSTAAGNVGINIHGLWPEAVVIYLEANRLVDHDGKFRTAADASLGDPDWSPRAPHNVSTVDHSDAPYLQTILLTAYFMFQFNPAQMYLAGHSSGAFFTLSMRALMPETFRAFAVLGTYADYRREGQGDVPAIVAAGQQAPARPVLYMMGEHEDEFTWLPAIAAGDDKVYDTVRQLTAINGAAVPAANERQYLSDLVNQVRAAPAATRVRQKTFAPVKTNGAEVTLLVFGGDHSWPPRDADDPTLRASQWAVDFFRRHMGPSPSLPSVLFEKGWTVPALMAPILH